MMARGTPEIILWMWCDGSAPMGNEEPMREFAAFYRSLPIGKYETVSEKGGVFVRKFADDKRRIYYVVNTTLKPAAARFAAPGAKAVDLVTGNTVDAKDEELHIPLQATGMRAFRVE